MVGMRVLDLFAGLRGWSQPFADRGHEVFTVELDRSFEGISLYADILTLTASDIPWQPDIILASPPCTAFTTMTMGRNWTYEGEPKTDTAVMGRRLVRRTLGLIAVIDPRWAIIENPRARLRTLPDLSFLERRTVWYCRYGEKRAKPTDLWGAPFPPSLVLRPGCHNGNPDHIAAPRGSRTGTQGNLSSREIAKVPYELALDVCLAAERDLAGEPVEDVLWKEEAHV